MRTSRGLRIGIDARTLTLPEIRGMASYLLDVLDSWPEPGDRFVLFTENPSRPDRLGGSPAVEWRRVVAPPGNRVQIWDMYALPRAIRRERLDLFWSPANRAFPVPGIPQVVTVHDTLLQEKVAFSDPVEGFFFRKWTPFLLRRFADRIVTVSRFSADRISRVMRFPESRIRVIHNGAALPERPFPSTMAARRFLAEYGVPNRDFIYALGAESTWKNTLGLLEAFRIVLRNAPDAFLVVSGIQGRAMERFRTRCREWGIEHAVRLTGFLPRDVRDALYQGAELFVYASLFEGFGLPPLEAMAMGTPVVASDAASIPEVVGRAALLVDASDAEALAGAILTMLRDEETRRVFEERGNLHVHRFPWDRSAREHRRLMEAVRAP